MIISPSFLDRTFTRVRAPELQYRVDSYSWSAIGGPDYATIQAAGDERTIQFAAQMLRYGVEILDNHGRALWWGYLHGVEMRVRNRVLRIDLGGLWNSITLEYNELAGGASGTGTRVLTSAAQDAVSIANYGRRELLQQATDISTAAAAEAKRNELLDYYRLPRVDRESVQRTDRPSATLLCRGWWHTLDWRYYSNATNANTATTTQIADIISAAGEFIAGTRIVDASGISTNPYRDGNDRAQPTIEQLLQVGTSSGRRLLAGIGRDRRATVWSELANDPATNYRLDALDVLRGPTGQVVLPHTCPVGIWISDGNGLIGPLGAATLADPGAFFAERAEYDVQASRLTLSPRGSIDPYDFVRVMPG
jgi:hypothetical protein